YPAWGLTGHRFGSGPAERHDESECRERPCLGLEEVRPLRPNAWPCLVKVWRYEQEGGEQTDPEPQAPPAPEWHAPGSGEEAVNLSAQEEQRKPKPSPRRRPPGEQLVAIVRHAESHQHGQGTGRQGRAPPEDQENECKYDQRRTRGRAEVFPSGFDQVGGGPRHPHD